MKKILLILFIIISNNSASQKIKLSENEHDLNKALTNLKIDPQLKNASIGFFAMDSKTGETIAELNPDLSLMPASTLKIITTATALEILGKSYMFQTVLQYSGTIDTVKKVLNGDIYIKGGADPTLGSSYFDKEKKYQFIKTWIDAIKKLNIDSINGRIIGDASIYGTEITPPKWSWEDIGNYYGSGANGLTAFDNLYEIWFSSPPKSGNLTQIIKVEPIIPGLTIYNEVMSSEINADEAYVFGAPYTYLHYIRGTIPKGKSEFKIKGALPDPAYYLAYYFREQLNRSGVKTCLGITTNRILENSGDSMSISRKEIQTNYSPTLTSIINITNKESINLFAEHLFNHIAYKLTKNGSNTEAIKAISEFWKNKGMDTDGFYIFDGSGLSRYNSVTPRQLVFVLNYMQNKSKNFTDFQKSLPIAGESGTLKTIGNNTSAKGNVVAKSGSIGRVRAYTGYVTSKSGRTIAFSMNLANYNCSSSEAREKLTKLMIAMADFNL